MKLKREQVIPSLLLLLITFVGLALRLWRFRENGELIGDEAHFANMATGVFNRQSVLGWESLLRFDYGLGLLLVIAVWEKVLLYLGLPLDEKTLHLPQVVFGILLIWTAYLVVKRMVSIEPALAVAALLAVMPMHVTLSRSIGSYTYGLGPGLAYLIIFLVLLWCNRERWYLAFFTGLATALYVQTDGLQLLLLAFIPLLVWLIANGAAVGPGNETYQTVSLIFTVVLVLGGTLLHPEVLRNVFPRYVAGWDSTFIGKLGIYTLVTMAYGLVLFVLISFGRLRRLPKKVLFVWRKLSNPWFLVPASLSFLIGVLIAVGSWVETGVPRGVLGHVFAKKELDFGLHFWTSLQDLRTVCGWPIISLIGLGLVLLPWTLRHSRAIVVLGTWAMLSLYPWIFAVSPSYAGRDIAMSASAVAVAALAVCSLWYAFERIPTTLIRGTLLRRRGFLFTVMVTLVSVATIPFAMANLTLKPVLGIEPRGNTANYYGAIRPVTGSKEAFQYVREHAGLKESVFSSYDKNVARYYLERPFGRAARGRVIGLYSFPHGAEFGRLFCEKGQEADWYIISKSFAKAYVHGKVSGVGLRALAKTTQVWQKGYLGPVEQLEVRR